MNTQDTCEQFQSLISADLDGELDQREQTELHEHLGVCAVCRHWQTTANRLGEQLAFDLRLMASDRCRLASMVMIGS